MNTLLNTFSNTNPVTALQPVTIVRLVDDQFPKRHWDDEFYALSSIEKMIEEFETTGFGEVISAGSGETGDPIICRNVREIYPNTLYFAEMWNGSEEGWIAITIRQDNLIPPGMTRNDPTDNGTHWGW